MIIIFPMLSPSTLEMLLQTKSASLESFVVSMQARNQFSKPSTEIELIQ
jgi:ABC-type enterochelin transport system permease subunit